MGFGARFCPKSHKNIRESVSVKKIFFIILAAALLSFVFWDAPSYAAAGAKPGLIVGGLHSFSADKSKLDRLYGGGVTMPLDKNARMNIEGYIGKAKSVEGIPDSQLSESKERLYMATVDYVLSSSGGSYLFAGGGFGYEKLKYVYQYDSAGRIIRENRSISGSSVVTDAGFMLKMTKSMSLMARYLMFVGGKNLKSAATLSLVFD